MTDSSPPRRRVKSDKPFFVGLLGLTMLYLLLVLALIFANFKFALFKSGFFSWQHLQETLLDPRIQGSVSLTMLTCFISAILAVFVAVPAGYLLSRYEFPGKRWIDSMLDIPIVLPPLVIGISLLILFNNIHLFGTDSTLESLFRSWFAWLPGLTGGTEPGITFSVPGVILAQFTVAAAFAVRTMRHSFDQISPRHEHVALTLGCNRAQAFWSVVLPAAGPGMITAGSMAWARAFGEFGPILVFAGATPNKTEVLSTTVFMEFNIGNIEGAATVSLLMVVTALVVLTFVRWLGAGKEIW